MENEERLFGETLRAFRREKLLTQEEAAKKIGISVQSVRLAERGIAGFSNMRKIQRWIDRHPRRSRG